MTHQTRPAINRVTRTALWGVVAQLATVANQLALVPLYLSSWGVETYGGWITLSALTSYLTLADAGMQQYVANRLTQAAVQERWDDFRADMASACLMYLIASSLVAIAAGGIALGVESFEPAAVQTISNVSAVTLLLGFQVSASLCFGFVASLYRVVGCADKGQLVRAIHRAALFLVSCLVLLNRQGPVALAATQLAVGMVAGAYAIFDTVRIDRRLSLVLWGARLRTAFSLLRPSFLFLLVDLSSGFTVHGITLVVSAALGPAQVVLFTTTRAVANIVRQVINLLSTAVMPELSRLDAAEDLEKLALVHWLLVKATCALALAATAALFAAGPILYELWTGGKKTADPILLRVLLLEQLATTPSFASAFLLAATNRVRLVSGVYLAVGMLQVGAASVVAERFGTVGVGAAVLVTSALIVGTLVPRAALTVIHESLRQYVRKIYAPFFAASVLVLGATTGTAFFASFFGKVPLLLSSTLVAGLSSVTLCWLFLLDRTERGLMQSATRGLVARWRAS